MRSLTPTRAIWCNGNTPKLGWNWGGVVRELTGARRCSNVSIKDKGGRTLITEEEQNKHFTEVLNQPEPVIRYDFAVLATPMELPVNMGDITEEETMIYEKQQSIRY